MPKKKKEEPKKEVVKIWAEYTFTEEEKREMAIELANKNIELGRIEGERKSVAANFKASAEAVDATINELARNLARGSEHRDIPCVKELDFNKKIVKYLHVETQEVVKEKAFDAEDYQRKMEI